MCDGWGNGRFGPNALDVMDNDGRLSLDLLDWGRRGRVSRRRIARVGWMTSGGAGCAGAAVVFT